MMPGENHSKAEGIAAEAAGSCQNCTSLQQSLNEYVAALIALKQKIIDSDHLIAEYQQKSDDLQDAERENKTLRCQLEEMLKKTSPREQTKHQLKTLRIELEKKSTIEADKPSKLEYARVKDECKNCNMGKKHEAKLKKLQAIASKHIKNVKKLQQEKRILERELKVIQKKLGDFQNKKTMKNTQTQVANDHPVLKLDKKKIRILLEELWNCIESSTENFDGDKLVLGTNLKKERHFKKPDECTLSISHLNPSTLTCEFKAPESAVVYAANGSAKCKRSNEIHTDDMQEHIVDKPFHTKTSSTDTLIAQYMNESQLIKSDNESNMEELLQIMNWAKPLPYLLSPLSVSPLTTKYVFGEFTDSSDNEGCEGRNTFVGNQAQSCTSLNNKLTCLQDQSNIFSDHETGNVTKNCDQNVGFETNENHDCISIVTGCMENQSEIRSNCKGDLITIPEIEIETDKNYLKITAANTITTNVLHEQNPAEKENNLLFMDNRENSVEKSLVCYPEFNVPVIKLNSSNDSKDGLPNPSSTGTVGNVTSMLMHPVHAGGFSERLFIKNMQCAREYVSNSARCNLPKHNDSPDNTNKLLISKNPALHNCNVDEKCSNEQEPAKSLQIYKITSARENHVHDNKTNAEENTVHGIITSAGENHDHNSAKEMPVHEIVTGAEESHIHCSITSVEENFVYSNKTSDAENLVHDNIFHSGETHVLDTITSAGESHVHDIIASVGKPHVHSYLSVDKPLDNCSLFDIGRNQDNLFLSTKPEMCSIEFNPKFNYDLKQSYNCTLNLGIHLASETVQRSLNDCEETKRHSGSSPAVQLDHTKMINQYQTENIELDPKYSQERSIKKESKKENETVSVINDADDNHCYKEKSNELGYCMQDSFKCVSASTDQTVQRDEASINTSLQLNSSMVDKDNNLCDSIGGIDITRCSVKKLEDENSENLLSDLQTYAIQMEKEKEYKHNADELGAISKFHLVTEKCKISSSETDQLCSSHSNFLTTVSSKEQKAIVIDVQSVIDKQQCISFQNESVDDQLCSSRQEQSSSTVLLHSDNTFPSNSDTPNADGFRNNLKEKSVDLVTESIDQLEKYLCKGVTPEKEYHAELDSEGTNFVNDLQSNNDTHFIKINNLKIAPVLPLEEQQHPNVPSESSKVSNKIADDSSEEDIFLVRKVSYTKVISRNPVKPKKYCKSASEIGAEEKVSSEHLELNDTPSNPVVHLADMACANDVLAYGGSENDLSMEHNSLVTVDSDVNLKNGKKDVKNTVDQQEKNVTTILEECEKEGSKNSQYSNQNTKENCYTIENEARKILPGKNLIWNFERPDDSVDPRVISGKHKVKANVKILNDSENLIQRTEKRQKLKGSQKVKCTGLDCEVVNKESHQQKLSVGEKGLQNIQVEETVLANADTSTKSDLSPETLTRVRSEMGPPLPPLLGPLLATPPKSIHPFSPILSSSSCSSLPSPLDDLISPLPDTPFPQLVSPLSDRRRQKSPVFATPSPAEKTNIRILSSPLQFCAATPKHALPVPGRLPLYASSSSSTSAQENSVRILDTMYPELSARARTLNILKGNVQLNRGLPTDGKNVSVNQISGFKPITSTSTAFKKADGSKDKLSSCKIQQQPSRIASLCKRTSDAFLMPKSAKKLRLDTESPVKEVMKNCSIAHTKENTIMQNHETSHNISYCELLPDVVKDSSVDEDIITKALKKIEDLCFDLLPVIKSHIFVGTIPKVPVMRNEEKEVIYEFSHSKKSLADRFLQVVLKKIKTEKRSMAATYLQALCRVYVGLCRQLGDIERARILCYSILKEDFPDPDRLLLFIVSSWNDILSTHGVVSKAIQAVLKNLAKEDVGSCLSAYLNWEKTPPMNVSLLLSSVLMAVQLCPDGKFQQSEKYGEDLTDSIWEYVFAVDLLCSHRKWVWTHDTLISKELWPLLDKWVKRKKGNPNVSFIPDIIAATVLRLVGYLCQMGLKEGFVTAVKNIGTVIIAFLQHANEEGMCWGVQLACVYMLCDLAPSDPGAIYKTLQTWKASAKNDIPPAVASCMLELESMCALSK